jgi:hypothetical protein
LQNLFVDKGVAERMILKWIMKRFGEMMRAGLTFLHIYVSVFQPGHSEKYWNRYINILKYRKHFQMYSKCSDNFCPAIGSTEASLCCTNCSFVIWLAYVFIGWSFSGY